jgi:hypothetical protein
MDGARLHSSPGLGVINSRLIVLFIYFEPKFDHSAIKRIHVFGHILVSTSSGILSNTKPRAIEKQTLTSHVSEGRLKVRHRVARGGSSRYSPSSSPESG